MSRDWDGGRRGGALLLLPPPLSSSSSFLSAPPPTVSIEISLTVGALLLCHCNARDVNETAFFAESLLWYVLKDKDPHSVDWSLHFFPL